VITIVDYGASNLRSVVNAFGAIGEKTLITNKPADLERATAIVLPGVGAFGDGMQNLRKLNLIEALNTEVMKKKKPYLGICLGLQFLARDSHENGHAQGLGWIDGSVQRIKPDLEAYRIPHMGWNDISYESGSPLFNGLEKNPIFYFVHSYHLVIDKGSRDLLTASCWHGTTVTAGVQKENIHAVQFHPEKSQDVGLQVLKNFMKYVNQGASC